MQITKLLIKNYKLLRDEVITLNPSVNIFVGDNDAGKSTILECLSIITTGKLNGFAFDRQLKANLINTQVRAEYIDSVNAYKNGDLSTSPTPPAILMEAYCAGDAQYQGTQNELQEDCPGIRVEAGIFADSDNANLYKDMLIKGQIEDVPIELYTVHYRYFHGEPVNYRSAPFKSVLVDAGRRDYSSVLGRFMSDNLADHLSDIELKELAIAYRRSKIAFQKEAIVDKLNHSVKDMVQGREVSLNIREDEIDAWKKQLSLIVDEIPFENMGFGTQNAIKIELALRNADFQANIVLMEEPENNLSFLNMTRLVNQVVSSANKQVFIATHSSYIANKLNLKNLLLVNAGHVSSFQALSPDTVSYFTKLPGYDTLRFVLASKIILTEGPTDDLILQRAYFDEYSRLPSEDGIDIFVVDGLAFKRFCEIAHLLKRKIVIVTDNDGDIEENIEAKYSEYLADFCFCFEKDESLHTIEPSVLAVNLTDGEPSEIFRKAISPPSRLASKRNRADMLNFMTKNKSEWAYRVFESDQKINYPQYILDAIRFYHDTEV